MFQTLPASLLILILTSLTTPTQATIPNKNGPYNDPPAPGFGTWNLSRNTSEAVAAAVEAGYRHFDCATAYNNQKEVGAGIQLGLQRTGLKRGDLWVTSKIWGNRHGGLVGSGIENNLGELGLEYVDLTLMHFPIGQVGGKSSYDYVATWKEMEKYAGEGKLTRFIGISNFNQTQVDDLLASATIMPKVHQFELHPYLQQQAFVDYHKAKNITVTAYAPLGNTNPSYVLRARRATPLLQNPVLKEIAAARGCTPAQVSLKWNMDRGVIPHPKTQRKERQKENFEAWTKCQLTDADRAKIKELGAKPQRFWEICSMMLRLPCYGGLEASS
ncbi:hypothetical protein EG328_005593 [Venturia inaequalis]|uniref:NADP-dependent oxidoreductase domain-containing protein n=1 Tax=Venturia inaequalis TaxID=5025 RepID=A0A8H3ZA89_VENIN|nr:hypothetical protein EG328_005593 [Venturia inaequalis]